MSETTVQLTTFVKSLADLIGTSDGVCEVIVDGPDSILTNTTVRTELFANEISGLTFCEVKITCHTFEELARDFCLQIFRRCLADEALNLRLSFNDRVTHNAWIDVLENDVWTPSLERAIQRYVEKAKTKVSTPALVFWLSDTAAIPNTWSGPTLQAVRWLARAAGAHLVFEGRGSMQLTQSKVIFPPVISLEEQIKSLQTVLNDQLTSTNTEDTRTWLLRLLGRIGFRTENKPDNYFGLMWARVILKHLRGNETRIKEFVKDIVNAAGKVDLDKLKASNSEYLELLGRALFLELLKQVAPCLSQRASASLDGAYELFTLQNLALSRRQNQVQSTFVAELNDESLRAYELILDCMYAEGELDPITSNFASARAVVEHIRGLVVAPESAQTLASAFPEQVKILFLKAGELAAAPSIETRENQKKELLDALENLARTALSAKSVDAQSALEDASRCIFLAEICALVSLRSLVDDLINAAKRCLYSSAGSGIFLSFDRCLHWVRVYILADDYGRAWAHLQKAKAMRVLLGKHNQDLAKLSLDWVEVHFDEQFMAEQYFKLMRRLEKIAQRSEAIGADEILSRVVYARRRISQEIALKDKQKLDGENKQKLDEKDKQKLDEYCLFLRLQNFVNVQAARLPELSRFAKRNNPKVFISYRAETRPLACEIFRLATECGIEPWLEIKNVAKLQHLPSSKSIKSTIQDSYIAAQIQMALEDSDAVLMLVSPKYFTSPYCTHEMETILSRQRLSNQKVAWVTFRTKEIQVQPVAHQVDERGKGPNGDQKTEDDDSKFTALQLLETFAKNSAEGLDGDEKKRQEGFVGEWLGSRLREQRLLVPRPLQLEIEPPVANSLDLNGEENREKTSAPREYLNSDEFRELSKGLEEWFKWLSERFKPYTVPQEH